MRYHILATDYDGTLATDGQLLDETREGLERLRTSGRKIVMVTGRQLDDLRRVCPDLSLFEIVVAENGAVLYWPPTNERRVLAEAPPPAFVARLRELGVPDVAVGDVVVATWHPHETSVLAAIRELGLELQVIFNKGAVMVLPPGVNKASGLSAALGSMGFSPHEAVGIGDAENDHAFLKLCECGVAVQNALPMLKERADLVTNADHGAGVVELIDGLLTNDLGELTPLLGRHDIPIGEDASSQTLLLPAYGATILLAGTSGGGKSTLVTAFVEQLAERGYQFCIIDPEGDYSAVPGAGVVGDRQSAPTAHEVLKLIEQPSANVVVNLLGIGIEDRPAFFEELMPQLVALRMRTGRPHFIVVDEAHHLAPSDTPPRVATTDEWSNVLLVTVHPKHVAQVLLQSVDIVVAVGAAPGDTISEFALSVGEPQPAMDARSLESGEAVLWWRRPRGEPRRVRTILPSAERTRHLRKYAHGDLDDRSFWFRGPEQKLNLKAQNLSMFTQLADGVDDATWSYHLDAGDYVRWIRDCIKDDELADEVEEVGHTTTDRSPIETRAAVRSAIERRYTAPA